MSGSFLALMTLSAFTVGPWMYGGATCPTCNAGMPYGTVNTVSGYNYSVPATGMTQPMPSYGSPYGTPAGTVVGGAPAVGGAVVGGTVMGDFGVGFTEAYGSGGGSEQLYPYDAPEPWMHGYIQHVPSYGGFRYFRPYNYKHVLAQSMTAAQWHMSPVMPYSQQFWHKYENKASLSKPLTPPQIPSQSAAVPNYQQLWNNSGSWQTRQPGAAAIQAHALQPQIPQQAYSAQQRFGY